MITVQMEGVTKSFGKTTVLDNIDLKLEDGRTYALLGRNGSGKTTMMNLLCTKYIPDSGVIKLLDEVAYENDGVLSEVCFMKDYIPAFENMKLTEIFKYAKKYYCRWNDALKDSLIRQFDLNENKVYGYLSKGQQTEVGLIVGLCSNTRILLLDEIYVGLDVVARKKLYTVIMEEQERYTRTIVLSSHLINEMTNLFTDVVIIDGGKVILNDSLDIVQDKSRKLIGRKDAEDILSDKKILGKNHVGTMDEMYLYDDLSENEMAELKERGYKISPMNLQELFSALTDR